MNALDDLLTAAGEVPDISPDSLRNGRIALDAAFSTGLGAPAAAVGRKPGHWLTGVRAKALLGTAVAAAGLAAIATVIAMPSSPTVTTPRTPTMAPAPATLTAAAVLNQAAHAAGSQPGWPDAQYWYIEAQYPCGGQIYTARIWLSRHGNGVLEKTGPKNRDSLCTADLVTVPIVGSEKFGPYTWTQLDALPTDPATLKLKLMTDFPGPDDPGTLFEDVSLLLVDTPAPPAVLEALFKVEASIPGVEVIGRYTDSLGRTGTALRLGRDTMVVDPASGMVLEETNDGSTSINVTQGPVTGEPKLTG